MRQEAEDALIGQLQIAQNLADGVTQIDGDSASSSPRKRGDDEDVGRFEGEIESRRLPRSIGGLLARFVLDRTAQTIEDLRAVIDKGQPAERTQTSRLKRTRDVVEPTPIEPFQKPLRVRA